MKTEPLKANQVRTRINRNKIRTYYIVAEDHNKDFHCLWFRTLMDQPMMLITPDATYKPKEEDVVILDNLNLLTDTFDDIVKEEIDGIPTPSKEDTQTSTIAHLEELIEELQQNLRAMEEKDVSGTSIGLGASGARRSASMAASGTDWSADIWNKAIYDDLKKDSFLLKLIREFEK